MSKATTIWCDYKNCSDWAGNTNELAEEIRKSARKEGWTYRNGKDYCPKHSK